MLKVQLRKRGKNDDAKDFKTNNNLLVYFLAVLPIRVNSNAKKLKALAVLCSAWLINR